MNHGITLGVIIVSVALSTGCSTTPSIPVAEFEAPRFKVIEYENSALGAEIPDWVATDAGELEEEFDDEYVFRFEQTGDDLTGVRTVADNMNAPAEIARLVSTRIQQRFAGAQVGDQDFVETYFENVVATVSEAQISGYRKYGDFWILKEYYDENGDPDYREYEYYVMFRVAQDHIDDLIDRAINDLVAETAEEQSARDRVREILEEGI